MPVIVANMGTVLAMLRDLGIFCVCLKYLGIL